MRPSEPAPPGRGAAFLREALEDMTAIWGDVRSAEEAEPPDDRRLRRPELDAIAELLALLRGCLAVIEAGRDPFPDGPLLGACQAKTAEVRASLRRLTGGREPPKEEPPA